MDENYLLIKKRNILEDHPIYSLEDKVNFKVKDKFYSGKIIGLKENRAIIKKEDNSEISVPYTLIGTLKN